VGRPREFDRDEALDRAVQVFWSRGFERTSVEDLTDSMGIQRGSLYAAFGGKHQLFLEALDRYEEHFYKDTLRYLEEGTPRDGIRLVFQQVVSDCACGGGLKGCFITNTAVALAEDDPETASRVRRNLQRLEEAFERALTRAEEASLLGREPRELARFFTSSLQGLRVLSRCGVALDVLNDAVEVTLSVLNDSAPKGAKLRKETLTNG
jgi:TetR/AcrR family transcriptional regulator, transcriptional repressor for nem operon